MMNEQIAQMGPMWALAGLSAGWLADTLMGRRGYGLIVDMGLGVGAGLVGAGLFLACFSLPSGMFMTFVVGFGLAAGAIVAQRFCRPNASGAGGKAPLGLADRALLALREEVVASGLPGSVDGKKGRPTPTGALLSIATTGIYLLRGIPLELQRAARARAVGEGTTLHEVLLKGLAEYAAGTWTPQLDGKQPVAPNRDFHTIRP
jgi:uncharacterized membrane protein YeaQ/YmgE (transglycosylase-associated protein family)